eukprot:4495974-Alexandrium_andersonii.AAC.1
MTVSRGNSLTSLLGTWRADLHEPSFSRMSCQKPATFQSMPLACLAIPNLRGAQPGGPRRQAQSSGGG